MTGKKIVYINPGDMIEVRICAPDAQACAAEWKAQSPVMQRPRFLRFDEHLALEVFDPVQTVFEGTGESRRQLLRRPD